MISKAWKIKISNFNFAKAGAPPVPSRTAVRPGHSLCKTSRQRDLSSATSCLRCDRAIARRRRAAHTTTSRQQEQAAYGLQKIKNLIRAILILSLGACIDPRRRAVSARFQGQHARSVSRPARLIGFKASSIDWFQGQLV